MNRQIAEKVQQELNSFLMDLGRKNGFRVHKQRARYDATTCTFTVETADEGAPTRKERVEQAGVSYALSLFGYQEIGRASAAHPELGNSPRLVGYSSRRRKFPFTVQVAGGKKVIINKALADKIFSVNPKQV